MSTIPNVSSIYRQLSSISTNINFSPTSFSQNNYHLSQKPINTKTSFQDMYSYKQQKHNQLMNKLHHSYKEHQQLIRQINGKNESQYMYQSNTKPYQSGNYYQQYKSNHYDHNNYSRYVIPKIRYRHIEDQLNKHKKNTQPQNSQQQQKNSQPAETHFHKDTSQLQKQFYEDDKPKQNLQTNQMKQIQKNGIGVQTSPPSPIINQQPKTTPSFHRHNLNNKYQQKIQNYYELCRKNINKNQQLLPQKIKQNKFVRPASTNHNKPMKLDDAIKLLSYD